MNVRVRVRCSDELAGDSYDVPRLDTLECEEYLRDEGTKVLNTVAHRKNDNSDVDGSKILLKLNASISRDESLKPGRYRGAEKNPVSLSKPSLLPDCRNVVTGQFGCELPRERFVNENAQRRSRPRSRFRALRPLGRGLPRERSQGRPRGSRPPRGTRKGCAQERECQRTRVRRP